MKTIGRSLPPAMRPFRALLALAMLAAGLWAAPVAQGFGGATFLDFTGEGGVANTGFASALPGTNPPLLGNLALDTAAGRLRVTATNADLLFGPADNVLTRRFDGRTPYSVAARIDGPFGADELYENAGIIAGADADNYAKLVVGYGGGSAGFQILAEQGGVRTLDENFGVPGATLTGASSIELVLTVDPAADTMTAYFRLNGEGGYSVIGAPKPLPPQLKRTTVYAGIATTSIGGGATPLQVSYDWFMVGPPVNAAGTPISNISFANKTIFNSASDALFSNPTTLAFGPDGRLYVGTMFGTIYALTLDAARNVTASQRIDTIAQTPNTNNDGSAAPDVEGRLLLGISFDPASPPSQPALYVTHSDPRIAYNNSAGALQINTRSGTITRLTGPGYGSADRLDVVTGLPRSRENHALNGMSWGPDGWLYVAVAGATNFGAPSEFFSFLPELYLSGAILRANVRAPGFTPVDASGVNSGGALGALAGRLELYATGFRNAYDLIWHSNNKLYVNENGGNAGYGTTPGTGSGDSDNDGCPGFQAIDPGNLPDTLHLVNQGDYAGHPNPSRGECTHRDGTIYNPAKPAPANYKPPIWTYAIDGNSTNGIAEYTADSFGGEMKGNLISATYERNNIRRVVLGPDGTTVVKDQILAVFENPLDVATDPGGAIFVADFGANAVIALTPNSGGVCPAPGDPATIDSDGDGYTDRDEYASGSDPCNSSLKPADYDGDGRADVSDPDDDNDGIPDLEDQLQYDPANGTQPNLPLRLEWNPGDNPLGGFRDTGFTGVQLTSGGTGALPDNVRVGAAGGFMSLIATAGTNVGATNTQDNALQVGFDASRPFLIRTRIGQPFIGGPPVGQQAAGLFLGLDEDNYVRLVAAADNGAGGAGVQLALESGGVFQANPAGQNKPLAMPGPANLELLLYGDPAAGTLTAFYRTEADGALVEVGTLSAQDHPAIAAFFIPNAKAGLLATNAGGSGSLTFGFDYFRINRETLSGAVLTDIYVPVIFR
jgi:glucose/arabinose dehydrogenase